MQLIFIYLKILDIEDIEPKKKRLKTWYNHCKQKSTSIQSERLFMFSIRSILQQQPHKWQYSLSLTVLE